MSSGIEISDYLPPNGEYKNVLENIPLTGLENHLLEVMQALKDNINNWHAISTLKEGIQAYTRSEIKENPSLLYATIEEGETATIVIKDQNKYRILPKIQKDRYSIYILMNQYDNQGNKRKGYEIINDLRLKYGLKAPYCPKLIRYTTNTQAELHYTLNNTPRIPDSRNQDAYPTGAEGPEEITGGLFTYKINKDKTLTLTPVKGSTPPVTAKRPFPEEQPLSALTGEKPARYKAPTPPGRVQAGYINMGSGKSYTNERIQEKKASIPYAQFRLQKTGEDDTAPYTIIQANTYVPSILGSDLNRINQLPLGSYIHIAGTVIEETKTTITVRVYSDNEPYYDCIIAKPAGETEFNEKDVNVLCRVDIQPDNIDNTVDNNTITEYKDNINKLYPQIQNKIMSFYQQYNGDGGQVLIDIDIDTNIERFQQISSKNIMGKFATELTRLIDESFQEYQNTDNYRNMSREAKTLLYAKIAGITNSVDIYSNKQPVTWYETDQKDEARKYIATQAANLVNTFFDYKQGELPIHLQVFRLNTEDHHVTIV